MSSKSGFKNKTLVYTFIGFNLVTFQSNAQTTVSECGVALQSLQQARQKLADACKLSGSSDCSTKALACDDTMKEDSYDTMGMIMEALGMPATATKSQASKACPQFFGKDWHDERKRLQQEIKDTEKELAELGDEQAKIQSEYDETANDLQEQLATAQEKYKETEEDLNAEERKMIAEFNDSQNQAKDNMRKLGMEILKLEEQVTAVQREKAQKLLIFTTANARIECTNEYAEAKAKRDKQVSVRKNSTLGLAGQATETRTILNKIFSDCLDRKKGERIQINQTAKSKIEQLQQQIRNTQSQLDEIQNSLNLAQSQLDEMKNSIANRKKNALQSVIDLGQRIQNQLQAAYKKLQTQIQTLTTKNTNLTKRLHLLSNELEVLGDRPPKGGTAGSTPDTVAAEISAATKMVSEAQADFDSLGCSRGRGGSGSSGGTGAGTGGTTQ